MSLRAKINDDLKTAMKAGDKRRISTLRLMNAAIKDKDINSRTDGHDSASDPRSRPHRPLRQDGEAAPGKPRHV